MTNQERLNKVFAKVFDNTNLTIEPHMTSNDVDGWDSMSHLNLIISVEKEFSIKITGAEVMRLKNIGDLINLVEMKTSTK
ncbi:MAG: acyl carrier protein [Bacteroidota bacterium]